jgi:hypothetical protein
MKFNDLEEKNKESNKMNKQLTIQLQSTMNDLENQKK